MGKTSLYQKKSDQGGDVNDFVLFLLSGRKFKNKIKKVYRKNGTLKIEGEINFERN